MILRFLAFFMALTLVKNDSTYASHILGGDISIEHVNDWDYKINLRLYRYRSGIPTPPSTLIEIVRRADAQQMQLITVPRDSNTTLVNSVVGCGTVILQEVHYYSAVIMLDSSIYNEPEGYYFIYRDCCRNPGIINLQNAGSNGTSIATLFPPVANPNGIQLINSSPVLKQPSSDFALQNQPWVGDFSAYDADGDSLVYKLYTPFSESQLFTGSYSNPLYNGKDPFSQFAPLAWANCYSQSNQINGASDPSCSSLNEPDRLQINSQTGLLTVSPALGPAYYDYGVWCQEFRNGVLIGSVFRDFQLQVSANTLPPNQPPSVHLPQIQALGSWSGDTIVFTGSPVCVQLGITDPDSIADIEIEVVHSDYDPGDLTFLQSSGIILNPDTFQTALCFQPDSFLPFTTRGDVVALNPGCYDLRGDTLPFYFKFVGYSNAGWGGNQTVSISPSLGMIDLFSRLAGNPNPGGIWYDLDSSGLLNANNQFVANNISGPVSYRFMYIDQQPNYPADTALLTLNFVLPVGFEEVAKEKVLIYPNPSNGEVTLEVSKQFIGLKAEIFSYDLKIIDSFRLEESNSSIKIDRPGLYFIRVEGQPGLNKVIVEN